MRHPSDDICATKSSLLSDKTIMLGVTGSIAAVECVKLCRELIRHGAEVVPVMTKDACDIIHPHSLQFATGNEPIVKITGMVEHVSYLGDGDGRADALLIAPATANTISKIACGIDDTTVTTMATTALGAKRHVVISPAMHSSMERHPAVEKNIKALKEMGVDFIEPLRVESKAKMAPVDKIVSFMIRLLGPNSLRKKRVLVIYGATQESIDDMRIITNKSSGRTGQSVALALYREGADVEVWRSARTECPTYIDSKLFESVWDLHRMISKKNLISKGKYDAIIVPAAISDFTTSPRSGKYSSDEELTLKLKNAPKILPLIRKQLKGKLVGFKAESGLSENKLASLAFKRLQEHHLDFIVANDIGKVTEDSTSVLIMDRKRNIIPAKGRKEDVAARIIGAIFS